MKRDELKKCGLCGLGVLHNNDIQFFRISIEHYLIDISAVKQQAGLEQFIGHAGIAAALGPDEDLAKEVGEKRTSIICGSCSINEEMPVAMLLESIETEDK